MNYIIWTKFIVYCYLQTTGWVWWQTSKFSTRARISISLLQSSFLYLQWIYSLLKKTISDYEPFLTGFNGDCHAYYPSSFKHIAKQQQWSIHLEFHFIHNAFCSTGHNLLLYVYLKFDDYIILMKRKSIILYKSYKQICNNHLP